MSSLDHLIITVVGARRAEARELPPAPGRDTHRRSGARKKRWGSPDPEPGRGEAKPE
jgi:hypothetical protein